MTLHRHLAVIGVGVLCLLTLPAPSGVELGHPPAMCCTARLSCGPAQYAVVVSMVVGQMPFA